MKVRIKFTKTGIIRYIGHLDMMRYFQKAFRRSGMDIGFTQGFSPHPEISIALPLGIGVTSESEYLDVTVNSCGHSAEMIELLNKEQVEGVRILSFRKIPDGKKYNAMAIVTAARYKVTLTEAFQEKLILHLNSKTSEYNSSDRTLDETHSEVQALFYRYLRQPEITVWKKTKRSEGESDIRPLIYEARACAPSGCGVPASFELLLAAGSASSLNPDTVMRAFASYLGLEPGIYPWQVHRLEIYTGEKNALVPLGELGEDV